MRKVFDLFPRLKERAFENQRGGTLSGGEQQMLAIGRALMARPLELLLLDEPSLGLAPLIIKHIFEAIKELNKTTGLTVFLVEQNAFGALKLADRGYVMVNGIGDDERREQGPSGQSGSAGGLSRRRASLTRQDGSKGPQGELRHAGHIIRRTFHLAVHSGHLRHGWLGRMDGWTGLAPRRGGQSLSFVFYMLLLGVGVRFIHFAPFGGTMVTLHYYIIDTIVLIIIGTLGYKYARTNQMVRQYHWLYEKVSPFNWKEKDQEPDAIPADAE